MNLKEGWLVTHSREKRGHFSYLYHKNRYFSSGKTFALPASTQNLAPEKTHISGKAWEKKNITEIARCAPYVCGISLSCVFNWMATQGSARPLLDLVWRKI